MRLSYLNVAGKLALLCLNHEVLKDYLQFNLTEDWEHDFTIKQDSGDGSIYFENYELRLPAVEEQYKISSPLNSREPWPAYITTDNDEDINLFYSDGTLTRAILEFSEIPREFWAIFHI